MLCMQLYTMIMNHNNKADNLISLRKYVQELLYVHRSFFHLSSVTLSIFCFFVKVAKSQWLFLFHLQKNSQNQCPLHLTIAKKLKDSVCVLFLKMGRKWICPMKLIHLYNLFRCSIKIFFVLMAHRHFSPHETSHYFFLVLPGFVFVFIFAIRNFNQGR